jgi:putative transposase
MEQQTLRTTFKEKLRPTPAQERALDEVLWRRRTLHNIALEQRSAAWQRRHISVSRFQQEAEVQDIHAECPEYAAIHSHVPQEALARLDKTYQAFFRRLQQGEKAGFPRFKGRNRFHSFTFKEYGNGATLDNDFLMLSTMGRIAVHWSRPIVGTSKTFTLSKEADGWYVAISCADAHALLLSPTRQQTGNDLGIEAFATLADGSRILTPSCSRTAEAYLATCQRRVARRKKGNPRWRKAVALFAKAHQQARRQRTDFHHKTALALVRAKDMISHEDVQTANLLKHHHLAKRIQDAGWAAFLSILSVTAACAGRSVVAVAPTFTSQRCSGCGGLVQNGLSVRRHSCPECGTSLHRDHNAAKNMQWRGQRLRGLAGAPAGMNREPAGL